MKNKKEKNYIVEDVMCRGKCYHRFLSWGIKKGSVISILYKQLGNGPVTIEYGGYSGRWKLTLGRGLFNKLKLKEVK
jgi:Fe2+ transport system protein FeoA